MQTNNEEFSVQFLNVRHHRPATDDHIHLILVMKGDVMLHVQGVPERLLSSGNIFVINKNTGWQLEANKHNIILVVNVSPLWIFHRATDTDRWHFTLENQSHPCACLNIRHQIQKIAILWLKKNSTIWRMEIDKALLEIFCNLTEFFQTKPPVTEMHKYSPKVLRVIAWIEANYQQPIMLQQIAAELHVTVSHLSRLFSLETGVNFRRWLTEVRFKHAAQDIALTTRPIGQITSESGFASMKRFSLLFRQHYGMVPSKYRHGVRSGQIAFACETTMLPEERSEYGNISQAELFSLLSQRTDVVRLGDNRVQDLITEDIHLDAILSGREIKRPDYVVAVGAFGELLKQHVQQQITCLNARVGLIKIQIDDPVDRIGEKKAAHCGETYPAWSPWSNLNLALGFLKQQNIAAVINLTPFSSALPFEGYLQTLGEFIRHNLLLSGRRAMQEWCFILDINLMAPFDRLVSQARALELIALIRLLVPECKTGLAAGEHIIAATNNTASQYAEIIKEVDFLCLSFLPAGDNLAEQTDISERYTSTVHQSLKDNLHRLQTAGIDKPLYLQSWSTLTGNTLQTHDPFFRGALLMEALLSLPEQVVMLGFWLNSELQHEATGGAGSDANSLSLFFSATTKRPVFHILALKKRLVGRIFSSGPCWMATTNNEVIVILLFNPVTFDPLLSVQEHLIQDYTKRFRVDIAVPEEGVWRVKQWVFDQKNGALCHQYGLHPTQYDRDEETMQYISRRSEPTLTVCDRHIEQRWRTDIIMDINAVCLLELRLIST